MKEWIINKHLKWNPAFPSVSVLEVWSSPPPLKLHLLHNTQTISDREKRGVHKGPVPFYTRVFLHIWAHSAHGHQFHCTSRRKSCFHGNRCRTVSVSEAIGSLLPHWSKTSSDQSTPDSTRFNCFRSNRRSSETDTYECRWTQDDRELSLS